MPAQYDYDVLPPPHRFNKSFNPFPTLIVLNTIRISETVPWPSRALADRSRATVGRVWICKMDNHRLGPTARGSTPRAHPGARRSPREHRRRRPDSVWSKSRSRALNVRSDRRHGHAVMAVVGADDIVAKTTSFRHFFLIGLSHLVPSVRALRRPRGKIARYWF